MDRRATIKWVLAASAALPFLEGWASEPAGTVGKGATAPREGTRGGPYGTDPILSKSHQPGDLWPLTFTADQRRVATALCDVIIPADVASPSAAAVGVVDFIDEWISAPYTAQQADRKLLLDGLRWLDGEANQRFSSAFHALGTSRQHAICDDICYLPKVAARYTHAAIFFARYRDLTTGGFYTTPAGRKDLRYVGNTPSATFAGPPLEVLKKAGLA